MDRSGTPYQERRQKLVVMGLRTKLALFFVSGAVVWPGFGLAVAQGTEAGEEGYDNVSLYATACEEPREGEARSSARIRATDKASFKAVENISELSEIRSAMPGQQFNVVVYNLADNYIEDLTVRTIEQNEEKLCVEVTGYLSQDNIAKVLDPAAKSEEQDSAAAERSSAYPDSLVLENAQAALQPAALDKLPPKPQPEIKAEIAAEAVLGEAETQKATEPAESSGTKVFIGKTKFFNDSETNSFFEDIKTILEEKPGIEVVRDAQQADYVLKPQVLRAKVDPINRQTNRLQMVIAIETLNRRSGSAFREHQNRFILFESSEDEQQVASDLMRKLLRKAGRKAAGKIRSQNAKPEANAAIITPAAPAYRGKNQL